jgi:Flp pilus assembly pilin Flp
MYQFVKLWLEFKTDRRAVTALEYGLIAAVIAGVAVVGFTTIGTSLNTQLNLLANKL